MSLVTGQGDAALLYTARVMHRRLIPPRYHFVYRVFYLLLDIDRIEEAARASRLFSHNRFNLIAFHDRDHGDGEPGGLRHWAEAVLATRGIDLEGGRIRLLCLPRLLGYGFNPLSLWYCEHRDGRLRAILAAVRNTFGESHCYLLAPETASASEAMPYEQVYEKDKCFHVSPLMPLDGRYSFRFSEPGERLRVAIHESRGVLPVLDATVAAERRPWGDAAILRLVLAIPLMSFKVIAAIHWQALKIWLRGAQFHKKPAPPERSVS